MLLLENQKYFNIFLRIFYVLFLLFFHFPDNVLFEKDCKKTNVSPMKYYFVNSIIHTSFP